MSKRAYFYFIRVGCNGNLWLLIIFGKRIFMDLDWIRKSWKSVCKAVSYLRFWPTYYEVWQRDCDCYEWSYTVCFPTRWHEVKHREDAYSNAEGPVSFYKLTRKEYKEYIAPNGRDRVLEAFEDGHPGHIYAGN